MIFDKHRFEIWSQTQHPYRHTLSDFGYTNPALPGVSDVNAALNWIMKVLYPTAKPAVANQAALPLVGNTLNDYRVVLDDGDGKAASYRWEQREGDVAAKWYKVMDMDWSTDSILAEYLNVTQELYVVQLGKADRDDTGTVIAGVFAGQTVYGGTTANQNLTLRANSGDGVGAHTGFVQVDDNFRPAVDATYAIGNSSFKFTDLFLSNSALVGTMTIAGGSITDSGGVIDFDNEDLTTTGDIAGNTLFATTAVDVGGTLVLAPGSIEDSGGLIDFGATDLSTTGTLTAASGSQLADITFTDGSIVSSGGAISFSANNLSTTGTLASGNATVTQLNADNIRLDGNSISILNAGGDLALLANGAGVVDVQSNMETLDIDVTGDITLSGQIDNGSLLISTNSVQATQTNADLYLGGNGTGGITVNGKVFPTTDNAFDLGTTALRFKDLILAGAISDGTTSISQATLQSFRDANVSVTAGMTLFWDGAKWVPSIPDTEVDHTALSNLTTGDSGHTQFSLLAGRAGGQTLQGGTASGEHLVLESTAHATKGFVKTKDSLVPFTNASYSGGWSGTDLGGSSNFYKDLYMKGEAKGFRVENYTSGTLPSNSTQNIGRLAYATDTNKVYVDTGTQWVVTGGSKFLSDTSWDGTTTVKDVTVSSTITDARNAIWALHDNTNDFDRIYCSIKAISATQVRITVAPALPAGSYRLIGLE